VGRGLQFKKKIVIISKFGSLILSYAKAFHLATCFKSGGYKVHLSSIFSSKYYFAICRHLGSQLAELERVIERMMEADFVEFATANLGRTTEDDMANEDLVDEVFLIYKHIKGL